MVWGGSSSWDDASSPGCPAGHRDAITWCLTTSTFVPRGAPQITNFMVGFSPCPFLSVTLSRCSLPVRRCRAAGTGTTSCLGPCDRRWVTGSVPVPVPALFPSRHPGDVPMPPARGAGVCRCGAGTRKSPTAGARAQGHQVSLLAPHPHHTASPTHPAAAPSQMLPAVLPAQMFLQVTGITENSFPRRMH